LREYTKKKNKIKKFLINDNLVGKNQLMAYKNKRLLQAVYKLKKKFLLKKNIKLIENKKHENNILKNLSKD
jgi:hypothetical protein